MRFNDNGGFDPLATVDDMVSDREQAAFMETVPDNHNPWSFRPLAFDSPSMRREYLRNTIAIQHDPNRLTDWPWVLAMDPEHEKVKP